MGTRRFSGRAESRLQPRLLHARLNYGSHHRGPGAEESRVNSRLGPVSELTMGTRRFSGRAESRLQPRLFRQRAKSVASFTRSGSGGGLGVSTRSSGNA